MTSFRFYYTMWFTIYCYILPMTTLDPQLNKLRNKELSFGCVISYQWNDFRIQGVDDGEWQDGEWNIIRCLIIGSGRPMLKDWSYSIIWHPLTRGRILTTYNQAFRDNNETLISYTKDTSNIDKRYRELSKKNWALVATIHQIESIFNEDFVLYEQNELQRMTSPKRPELRELLVKFAEYI